MFETAFTLSLTQFARTFSFPERLQRRAGRNAALEAFRLRNTGLDAMFYDIKALTPDEVFYVSDAIAAEGLIMIVPPTGGPMLTLCDSVNEYVLRGGTDVHMLAISGIGGSALGAAAFARNVADAMGAPVAAVVSGFGLGDIVNETIGGSFLFGWLGNFRTQCQIIDDVVGRPQLGAYSDRKAALAKPQKACLDVDTAQALLADERLSFHLLAGHSKGSLVLSEALHALRETAPDRISDLAGQARIVTFGARIAMPAEFHEVTDIIGELDWFGEINSRPKIDGDVSIPLAGHSTNTDLVGALPVTSILRDIEAKRLPALPETDHALVAIPEPIESIEAVLPMEESLDMITAIASPPAVIPLPEAMIEPVAAQPPAPTVPAKTAAKPKAVAAKAKPGDSKVASETPAQVELAAPSEPPPSKKIATPRSRVKTPAAK